MNFRADRAGGVAETVAREDVVFEWVLLEDLLAEIDFSKELGAICAVVHRSAVGVTAEEELAGDDIRQGAGQ